MTANSPNFNFHELKAANRLPSPSGTALAIMELVQQDDVTIQQIAQLAQTDPALSGRIIAFANSAAFGLRRPVVSIQDAVIVVGMTAVRNFALSLSLIGGNQEGRCKGFDYQAYWTKSLLLAVTIAAVISREGTAPPEEAFSLGLLAGIGRLALATAWPDIYDRCLKAADERELLAMERAQFAIDHNVLTLMIFADWGLPAIFLDALKMSFDGVKNETEITRTVRFAKQLIFANHVTDYCLAGESAGPGLLAKLESEAAGYALDSEGLANFIKEILVLWEEWGRFIGISTKIPDAPEHRAVASPTPAPAPVTLDLLLVDDDPVALATLTQQLSIPGYHVHACQNGEEALKYVVEYNVQMVITEWKTKPIDGLQLCKSLRTTGFGKNVYFILLSGAENEAGLVEAFDAGIDDYTTKPVNVSILLARIRAGQRIIKLQQTLLQERQELERSSNELVVANRRLQHLANTDLLTGLANRRYALSRLEQEWETAHRFNRPLSIMMMDLDYFKSINDTLGHAIGDQVLAHTAKVIREVIRTTDVPCRLGGEEFIVIAPNTDQTAAHVLAERIRKSIETQQLKNVNLRRPLTISIGVAGSTGNKPGWQDLMKLADQALYYVKHHNRNAVKLAS